MWANVFRYNEGIETHGIALRIEFLEIYISWTRKQYNLLFRYRTCTNKTKCLTYFPSNLVHWVVPNLSDIERVRMAFDTIDFQRTHVHLQLKTQDD